MYIIRRDSHNPLIAPRHDHAWESVGTFNPSPIITTDKTHIFYRAISRPDILASPYAGVSSIGHAESFDGKHFQNKRQVVIPEHEWEKLGCEDPRVTFFEGKYYIFYTAVRSFNAEGIRVAVAISDDCNSFNEKHLVTPFNAKAFALFPERVNGKVTAIFSAHTDEPPAKMVIAQADNIEDFWNRAFWETWHEHIDEHTIQLPKDDADHVEVGAVPVKTDSGWLLIYSHIQNYFDEHKRLFGIAAALLKEESPQDILGQTHGPMLVPEELYERYGHIANVVFPSGAVLHDTGILDIYYGGADTTCNRAQVKLDDLLDAMNEDARNTFLTRAPHNPIAKPIPEHSWENKWVFNAGAVELGDSIHMLYRAMGQDNTSTLGYVRLNDGITVDERLPEPVYVPREDFEIKKRLPDGYSGCEDPRITIIDDTIYMLYTAYDGVNSTHVALTSISPQFFLEKKWDKWTTPQLITPDGMDDKDMCLLGEKINNQYFFMHRIDGRICADVVDDLDFTNKRINRCIEMMAPRPGMWDSEKIGIAGPPMKTEHGWLLIYHGVSKHMTYRLGAALLDANDPTSVIARLVDPILEPLTPWEKTGQVNNVVFSCGSVIRNNTLYLYYGGADTVMAVATMPLSKIMNKFFLS